VTPLQLLTHTALADPCKILAPRSLQLPTCNLHVCTHSVWLCKVDELMASLPGTFGRGLLPAVSSLGKMSLPHYTLSVCNCRDVAGCRWGQEAEEATLQAHKMVLKFATLDREEASFPLASVQLAARRCTKAKAAPGGFLNRCLLLSATQDGLHTREYMCMRCIRDA
jgi:hypothetical protein